MRVPYDGLDGFLFAEQAPVRLSTRRPALLKNPNRLTLCKLLHGYRLLPPNLILAVSRRPCKSSRTPLSVSREHKDHDGCDDRCRAYNEKPYQENLGHSEINART